MRLKEFVPHPLCSRKPLFFLLGLFTVLTSVRGATDCAAIDPFEDPKDDRCNPFRYIPNKAGKIIVAEFFTHSAFFLLLCYIHRPIRWFLVLLIGSITHSIGLWFRLGIRALPHSIGFIVVEEVLVALSPCVYLAALYVLLGRITQHLDGAKYLRPIKPEKVAKIFVWSDAITFLIQGNASGLLSNDKPTVVKVARYAILVGLILQFISFLFFCYLVVMFLYRVRKEAPQLYRLRRWKRLYLALMFTCIAMLVRSIYRIAEYAQNHPGYSYTHEVYFFTLDCLPMWLVISTHVIFWPGRHLTDDTKIRPSILDGVPVDDTVMLDTLDEEGRRRLDSESAGQADRWG